jgi:hypothetical protein
MPDQVVAPNSFRKGENEKIRAKITTTHITQPVRTQNGCIHGLGIHEVDVLKFKHDKRLTRPSLGDALLRVAHLQVVPLRQ